MQSSIPVNTVSCSHQTIVERKERMLIPSSRMGIICLCGGLAQIGVKVGSSTALPLTYLIV